MTKDTHRKMEDATTEFEPAAPITSVQTLVDQMNLYGTPVIVAFGLIGNTLVLFVTSLQRNRDNVMYLYFKCLSVCDALSLLPYLVSLQPEWTQTLGYAYCIVYFYFGYVFYGSSMWQVVVVAVDRFIVVQFPLRASSWCTMHRAKLLTSINVVAHFVTSGVNFWKRPVDGGGQVLACALPQSLVWFELVKAIFNIFLPLILICLLNLAIILALHLHDKKMQSLQAETADTNSSKDRGMTAMLLLVATFSVILNLPRVVDKLIWSYLSPVLVMRWTNARLISGMVVYLLSMTNNSINFFLYCFGSKYFRRDLTMLCQGRR